MIAIGSSSEDRAGHIKRRQQAVEDEQARARAERSAQQARQRAERQARERMDMDSGTRQQDKDSNTGGETDQPPVEEAEPVWPVPHRR